MLKTLLTISVLLISHFGFSQKVKNPEFQKVLEDNLKLDVPNISIEDVGKFYNPIILDARSLKEFNVSHLKGAIHVDFVSFDINKLSEFSKNETYIVYCSVVSRSEQVTKLLIDNGYSKSFNLYGGIFEWTNLENPVIDSNNKLTNKVHGVTKDWAVWIEKAEVILD